MRLALALLLAAPLLAQTPRYQEELTVAEVSIELTVTDRDGNPVTGLTAADFEVLEDGKAVPITFFREVRAAAPATTAGTQAEPAPPAASEPRILFIFIDNREVDETIRRRLFENLRSTVSDIFASGGEVFYFVWTGKLQAVKPKDLAKAHELLTLFEKDPAYVTAARGGNRSRRNSVKFDMELAQSMARTKSFDLLAALDAAGKIVAKFPGRRMMLFASRGFSIPVHNPFDVKAAHEAAAAALGDHPLATNPLFAPEIMIPTHGEASLGTAIEDAAAAVANRHGFPVYGLFSGGLQSASMPAGITTVGIPTDAFAVPVEMRQVSREVGSVADLAERTGGLSMGAGSNFGPFLEKVARDLNNFYTISYRSAAELRFRRLEVRPKNRDLVVRHREAAVPDDDSIGKR